MERILELWATVLAWYHDPFTATAQLLEGIRDNLPLTHRVLAGACHLLSAARDALTGPTRTVPAASDEWVTTPAAPAVPRRRRRRRRGRRGTGGAATTENGAAATENDAAIAAALAEESSDEDIDVARAPPPPARALPPATAGDITVGARIAIPGLVPARSRPQAPAVQPRKPPAPKFVPDPGILAQLLSMGFDENGCKRACKATNNQGAEAASEWVFSHMGDADFAAPFVDDETSSEKKVDEAAVNELMMFGFTPRQAEAALTACDSNKEEAAEWLLSRHDDGIDAAVAEVLDGPAPAPPSDAVGVVEGVDGGRVVVKMDCGPRVVVTASSIMSRVVVAAADAAGSPADVWFREEAFVNILPFLDGRSLARFVLASRRPDVRRWAVARIERALAARAPALLAARQEVDLFQWFAGSIQPQLAATEGFTPRSLPLDRTDDYWGALYLLFAALPRESVLCGAGCQDGGVEAGVEAYASLQAYVYRTGGPDDEAGARALLATLREAVARYSTQSFAEGEPCDAEACLYALESLLNKNAGQPRRKAATLESSHYDADDALAIATALGVRDYAPWETARAWSSGVVNYACNFQQLDEQIANPGSRNTSRRRFECSSQVWLEPRPGDSLDGMIDASHMAWGPREIDGFDGTAENHLWSTGRVIVFKLDLQMTERDWSVRFKHELVDDPVSFPVRGLDLSRRARRPALSELFDLVGALFYVYHGPEDGAHFETVTYHDFSRRWFRFVDDDPPTPLASFDDYVAEEGRAVPHLLVYRRRP